MGSGTTDAVENDGETYEVQFFFFFFFFFFFWESLSERAMWKQTVRIQFSFHDGLLKLSD